MTCKAFILHHRQTVRERLKSLLRGYSSVVRFMAESENVTHALKILETLRPDVLYLDTVIEGMDPFALVKNLTFVPHLIFVTDCDRYATKAFEYGALDYLINPIHPERFTLSIARLQKFHNYATIHQYTNSNQEIQNQSHLSKIQIRNGDEIRFVSIQEILFFEAQDYYSSVNTVDQKYLIRISLSSLEDRLPPEQFVRIHRKFLVNLHYVDSLYSTQNEGLQVILKNSFRRSLTVSRRYNKQVKDKLIKTFADLTIRNS